MTIVDQPIEDVEQDFESLVRRPHLGLEDARFCRGGVEEAVPLARLHGVALAALGAEDHCLRAVVTDDAYRALDSLHGLPIREVAVDGHACEGYVNFDSSVANVPYVC